jgi:hypothetical protein
MKKTAMQILILSPCYFHMTVGERLLAVKELAELLETGSLPITFEFI